MKCLAIKSSAVYYHPNNATAIVVGDFDEQTALDLIAKHFAAIPSSAQPIPPMYTVEPPQEGENRFVLRRAGQLGVVELGWRTPEGRHADIPALSVLDHILSAGVTSRLYQALVETQLALGASSHAFALLDPGLFTLTMTLRPGVKHEEVEAVALQEIEKLKTDFVSEAELRKAKNIILTHLIYLRDSPFGVVSALGEAEGMADWKDYVDFPNKIEAVTLADIQRVAQQYFITDARTVGYFVPKN